MFKYTLDINYAACIRLVRSARRQCVWIVLLEKHPRHLLLSARGVRLALMLRLARRLAHSAQPDWLTPTATHRVHVQLVLQVSTLASVQQSAHRVLPVV